MDNFNKLFSFILGLIVVVVFFAVLTGVINFKNKFTPLIGFKTTPTPTKTITVNNTNKKIISSLELENKSNNLTYNNYSPTLKTNNLQTIPKTGLPTFILPLLFSTLVGGVVLGGKK